MNARACSVIASPILTGYSKAPMSILLPWMRLLPRKSVVPTGPALNKPLLKHEVDRAVRLKLRRVASSLMPVWVVGFTKKGLMATTR